MRRQRIQHLISKIDSMEELSELQKKRLVVEKFNNVNYKLYKYYSLSSDYTFNNIENDVLYLNTPKAFNDPFDCFLGYHYQDLMRQFCLTLIMEDDFQMNEFAIEAFGKLVLDESLSELESKLFNSIIQKYGKEFATTNIDYWKNQSIEEKLPLICNLLTDQGNDLIDTIVSCCKNMAMLQANVRNAINNNFVVTCFSETYDNELMWAHYADKHRGICVEYDMSKMENNPDIAYYKFFTYPIIYSESRPQIPIVLNRKEKHNYSISEGKYSLSDRYKFLLTKSKAWKYEREWRMILPKNKNNIIYFPLISKIYLGVNISEIDEQRIKQVAARKCLDVQKLQLSYYIYKIY